MQFKITCSSIRIYTKLILYSIILANQTLEFDIILSDSVIDIFVRPQTKYLHELLN